MTNWSQYLTLNLWLRWPKKNLLSLFCECADMGILYGRNHGKLTIKAPCTPLPLKFGAYSDRSIVRNHSMTLWFVHKTTSPGTLYRFPWKQSKYNIFSNYTDFIFEPWHEISNNVVCAPAQAQTSLRICAVWSEPLLVSWIFYEC